MHKQSTAVILASFLPAAMAHIGLWHPSVYGFDGNGYSNVEPLSNKPFDQWWMHGQKDNGPKDGAALELPAGGEVNVELACNKDFTSFGGQGGGNDPCPPDTPSMHAGTPVQDSQLRGCALAIAYKNNILDVQPEDLVVFSVNQRCVKDKNTAFKVPEGMPACDGKCICAWLWQGQESSNEMYMNGFDCKITNPGNSVLAKPQVPTECPDGNGCTQGAKQPMYWANDRQNVQFSGEYERKPAYNDKWGFKDGAQTDIFEGGSSAQLELPSPEPTQSGEPRQPEDQEPEEPEDEDEDPEPTPGEPQPVTVTVTVAEITKTVTETVSKRGRPTPCRGPPQW